MGVFNCCRICSRGALDNPEALQILYQDFQLKFEYLEPGGQGANIRESAVARCRGIYERLSKPWAANRRPAGIRKKWTSISFTATIIPRMNTSPITGIRRDLEICRGGQVLNAGVCLPPGLKLPATMICHSMRQIFLQFLCIVYQTSLNHWA